MLLTSSAIRDGATGDRSTGVIAVLGYGIGAVALERVVFAWNGTASGTVYHDMISQGHTVLVINIRWPYTLVPQCTLDRHVEKRSHHAIVETT
jgi:hypothetical protein